MARQEIRKVHISEIRRAIAVNEREVKKLEARKRKAHNKIASIDAQIHKIRGGSRAISGRRRLKNDRTLVEHLTTALNGKEMNAEEAKIAVMDAGYQSSATTFMTILRAALGNRKKFKRVSRGVYTAI